MYNQDDKDKLIILSKNFAYNDFTLLWTMNSVMLPFCLNTDPFNL